MLELVLVGALVASVLVITGVLRKQKSTGTAVCYPPGPVQTMVMGNFKDIDTKRVHQSLHQLYTEYGSIVYLRLLKKKIVILNTGYSIRKAFDNEAEMFNDKPVGFYGTYLVFGHQDVLLGPYCDRTFQIKDVMYRGLLPAMEQSKMATECDKLVVRIAEEGDTDFNMSDVVGRIMSDVYSIMLSGEIKETDHEILWDFVNWSNKMLNPSIETVLKNLPFLRNFPGKYGTLFASAKEKRNRLLKRFLDDTRANYKAGEVRCLVDTCIQAQREEKGETETSWLTDDMIRAIILDTIGGGLVTTTNTIICTLLNLLHHRHCLDKIYKEITSVLGNDKTATPSDIKNMPYSQAVVMETQRYSTLVPVVSHLCSCQGAELDGYRMNKGTMVWGNIWSAHHSEDAWSDPWSFNPERFLHDDGTLLARDHPKMESFMPLGVGRRICPGGDWSMQRIFAYVIKIVQQFDILPPTDCELMSNDPNLFAAGAVLQPDPLYCRVVKRVN